MKKLVIGIVILVTFCQSDAHVDDVYGRSIDYIKVTESLDKTKVKFEYCNLLNEYPCRPIGKNGYYSKQKLTSRRNLEKWDILKSSAAVLGIFAFSTMTGGLTFLGTATTIGASDAVLIYGTVGAAGAVGGTVAWGAMALIDAVNPYEQYKQLETLEPDVLNDKKVVIDYDIETFAKRLAVVLSNIK